VRIEHSCIRGSKGALESVQLFAQDERPAHLQHRVGVADLSTRGWPPGLGTPPRGTSLAQDAHPWRSQRLAAWAASIRREKWVFASLQFTCALASAVTLQVVFEETSETELVHPGPNRSLQGAGDRLHAMSHGRSLPSQRLGARLRAELDRAARSGFSGRFVVMGTPQTLHADSFGAEHDFSEWSGPWGDWA